MTFAEMVKLLHEGEYTKKQIQERLGIANNTVQRWLEVLYRRKLVYIAAWERGPRGNPAVMWAFGYEMQDAPKPKPLTHTEYVQRYRAKKRGVLGLVNTQLCTSGTLNDISGTPGIVRRSSTK